MTARQVAESGFDWDALHLRQEERRLGYRHDLDDVQTDELVAVLGASYAFEAGDLTDGPISARALAAFLTDPDVAARASASIRDAAPIHRRWWRSRAGSSITSAT